MAGVIQPVAGLAQRAMKMTDRFWIARADLWNPPYLYFRSSLYHLPPHWSAEVERHYVGTPGLTLTGSLEVNARITASSRDAYFFFPVGGRVYLPLKWKGQRPAEGIFMGAQFAPFFNHTFWLHVAGCPACPTSRENAIGAEARATAGFQKHLRNWSFSAYSSFIFSLDNRYFYGTAGDPHLRLYLTVGRIFGKK